MENQETKAADKDIQVKKKSIAGKLVKPLIVIAVLFVGLEIGGRIKVARLVSKDTVMSKETSWGQSLSPTKGNLVIVMDPFAGYIMKPNQKFKNTVINKWGFRTRDFEEEKPAGVYRIIITGGSAAYGSNVFDDKDMFDRLLEAKLNAAGTRKFEVINTGTIAYISSQELGLFIHYLMRFKPDMVINFTGWNDFNNPQQAPENNRDAIGPFMELEMLAAQGPVSKLAGKSMAITIIERETNRILRRHGLLGRPQEGDWKKLDTSVARFDGNMTAFAALSHGLGIAHIIALQPEESHRKNPCDAEAADLKNRGDKYIDAVRWTYDAFGNAAKNIDARFPNTKFVDLRNVFDSSNDCVWTDWVHFNEKGHQIVADRLFNEISAVVSPRQAASAGQ